METTVVRTQQGYRVICTARQHEWAADAPEDSGGDDSASTPEELFLGALGACMSMTGRMYANRKGWALDAVEITLDMERIDPSNYPGCAGEAKFTHKIREQILLKGDLDDDQKARVLEIMRKCPVRRVVENPVVFEEILIDAEPAS